MDIFELLLAKKLSGSGGGGGIIPSGTKTITSNGNNIDVYSFAKVNVNVPNPSTGKLDITTTSEVDVTNYASAQVVDADLVASNIKKDVNILGVVGTYEGSGGGGSGGGDPVFLGSDEVTVNTTSTTPIEVKTCTITSELDLTSHLVLCLIRDKAGKRNGYFYQTLSANFKNASILRWVERITNTGLSGFSTSQYGVYPSYLLSTRNDNTGLCTLNATISAKYSSTSSLTIDGTYTIEFYLVNI